MQNEFRLQAGSRPLLPCMHVPRSDCAPNGDVGLGTRGHQQHRGALHFRCRAGAPLRLYTSRMPISAQQWRRRVKVSHCADEIQLSIFVARKTHPCAALSTCDRLLQSSIEAPTLAALARARTVRRSALELRSLLLARPSGSPYCSREPEPREASSAKARQRRRAAAAAVWPASSSSNASWWRPRMPSWCVQGRHRCTSGLGSVLLNWPLQQAPAALRFFSRIPTALCSSLFPPLPLPPPHHRMAWCSPLPSGAGRQP